MSETVIATKTEVMEVHLWNVVIHNDDYTPMDFVMAVLQQIFGKSRDDAYELMMYVHTKGRAVVASYTREIAEAKVAMTNDAAAAHGHPLKTTAEPA
jgi:ATP-dependent Clp protease adaptor protein ClpS